MVWIFLGFVWWSFVLSLTPIGDSRSSAKGACFAISQQKNLLGDAWFSSFELFPVLGFSRGRNEGLC